MPPQPATITYVDGALTIRTSNSSLNQILKDVSRLAGVNVTGTIADERVFGIYGPGKVGEVLRMLLDGASCNMFFVQGADGKASELTLTPRATASPDTSSASYAQPIQNPPQPVPPPVPNPPRTPQQIYQELQQARQQADQQTTDQPPAQQDTSSQ